MEDEKIVQLILREENLGLEAAMAKYQGLAFAIALSVLGGGSREDAAECVNSAFHDLWRSMPGYDGRASLKGWIALLARRRAIDRLRQNQRRGQGRTDFPLEDFPAGDPCAEIIEEVDFNRRFNEFIRGLPEPDRSIFVRRYFALEDITHIACRYNLTRGAVDSRLSRLRKSLKIALERSEDTCGMKK